MAKLKMSADEAEKVFRARAGASLNSAMQSIGNLTRLAKRFRGHYGQTQKGFIFGTLDAAVAKLDEELNASPTVGVNSRQLKLQIPE